MSATHLLPTGVAYVLGADGGGSGPAFGLTLGRGPVRKLVAALAMAAFVAAILPTVSARLDPAAEPAPAPARVAHPDGSTWPAGLREAAGATVAAAAFDVAAAGTGTWRATNPAHGLDVGFSSEGVEVRPAGRVAGRWSFGLALTGVGRGRTLAPPTPAEVLGDAGRVELGRGALTEWYVNDARGLEQGFTLAEAPPGAALDPVVVAQELTGDLVARVVDGGRSLVLADERGTGVAVYEGLVAFDANGADLAARMALVDGELHLEVDDTGAVYPIVIDPVIRTQQAKLTASDAGVGDQFGLEVAVSGDTAVVGAPFADEEGVAADAGGVYVYVRDSGGAWVEQAKLVPGDSRAAEFFGRAVAIDGDTVVVGSCNHNSNACTGAVYVFERTGTSWTEQVKIAGSTDGTPLFGASVALEGDTMLVGVPNAAPIVYNNRQGAVVVYERSVAGTWSAQATLIAADGADFDHFGDAVALSGNTAVVGAVDDDDDGISSGSSYVFVRGATDAWSQEAKLTASDAHAFEHFGTSVALSGDTALVGAPGGGGTADTGSAYVFVRASGGAWAEQITLLGADTGPVDLFGSSVAVQGDTALVGAPGNAGGGIGDSGSVYVFVSDGTGAWPQQAQLTAADATFGDQLGKAVALDGDTAVAGAYQDRLGDPPFTAGSAYVFVADPVVDDVVVDDCADPELATLTGIEGDLIVENVPGCEAISLPDLTEVDGSVSIVGNTSATTVDLGSLQDAGGTVDIGGNTAATTVDLGSLGAAAEVMIAGNTSATTVDLGALTTTTGSVTIVDNTAATTVELGALQDAGGTVDIGDNTAATTVDLGSLTGAAEVTIEGNTSATTVDLGSLTTTTGSVTIVDNTAATAVDLGALQDAGGTVNITDNGSATVTLGSLEEVGGDVTVETTGNGAFDVGDGEVSGSVSLATEGYSEVAGATAAGDTSVQSGHGDAVMSVLLPTGTFEAPVAFTITRSAPADLPPEEGTDSGGDPAIVNPIAAYEFGFAVPTLGQDATLSFDVYLDGLDEATREALLVALDEGTATLATRGDGAEDDYQAFALCAADEVPTAEGCVLVERLDADGLPTTDPPAIVRFTGVTGHFSTWAVALVEAAAGDTTPPVIAPRDDLTIEATSGDGAQVAYAAPQADDDIDGPVAVTCSPASGSVFALGTTVVACSTEDSSGNTATSSFEVLVQDTTGPTITVPDDFTVPAAGTAGTAVTFEATANDAVDGLTAADCTPPSGSVFPIGVTTVTCTQVDAHGNAAVPASFDVTVRPAQHPAVTRVCRQLDALITMWEDASSGRRPRLNRVVANALINIAERLQSALRC